MTPRSFADVTSVMVLPRNLKSRFMGSLKEFASTVLQREVSFVLSRHKELVSTPPFCYRRRSSDDKDTKSLVRNLYKYRK